MQLNIPDEVVQNELASNITFNCFERNRKAIQLVD